jgi:hypothetical protein
MIGEISTLQVNMATTTYKKVESSDTRHEQEGAKVQQASGVIKDKVTLNTPEEKEVTYSAPLNDQERLDNKFLMLRRLVANLFESQGVIGPSDANGNPQGSSIIDIGDGKTADISTMTPNEAQKLVGEDGYWGVKQTSDRIFQQAVGISGNDPTKIDKIKEGILKGFDMAKKAFGGELPAISQQTLEAVMKKLEEWTTNPAQ